MGDATNCLFSASVQVEEIPRYGDLKNGKHVDFKFADSQRIDKKLADSFLKPGTMNSSYDRVEFLVLNFPVNLVHGSSDSISLLKSMQNCENDVFYTNAALIVDYKWSALKKYAYANSIFFCIFMSVFVGYIAFFFGNTSAIFALLLLSILSLLYEFF